MHLLWLLLYTTALACILAVVTVKILQWDHPYVPGPKGHWLLGNTQMISGKLHVAVAQLMKEYGPLCCVRVFHFKAYLVSDPEAASKVLRGGPSVAVKFAPAYWMFDRMTYPPCQSSLSVPDNDPFLKPVRAAAAHAFSTASLRSLFTQLSDATLAGFDAAVRGAASGPSGPPRASIDMDALFLRITIDVMGHFLLGRTFGACTGGPCPELEIVNRECAVIMAGARYFYGFLMFWRKDRRQEERWNRDYYNMVKRIVAEMKANPPPPHTLGAQLLAATDASGNPIPEHRLTAEVALYVMGGFENNSHATAIVLFCIISHPRVEERVCAELDALGLLATPARRTPRRLQWEDLSKLRVLNAAIQEAMRWLPVAPAGTGRVLKQPMEICGKILPRHSLVWVPIIGMHRDPRNWDRPDEYDIDRWLAAGSLEDAALDGGKERRGFMPFVEGPRSCPGQSLARFEITTVLAQLLGSFRVELAPEVGGPQGFLERLEMKMSVRPKGGMPCRLLPRVPSA